MFDKNGNKVYIRTINSIVKSSLESVDKGDVKMGITANELKTKGVSAIESHLKDENELVITVRGKDSYVVMNMEHYNYLRECELEAAVHQARADVEAGNYVVESVSDHIKRIRDGL